MSGSGTSFGRLGGVSLGEKIRNNGNYSGLQQIWNKTDKKTWVFSEKIRSFLNPL
jgi:hypothetical protein